jgi:hypothetical protein
MAVFLRYEGISLGADNNLPRFFKSLPILSACGVDANLALFLDSVVVFGVTESSFAFGERDEGSGWSSR